MAGKQDARPSVASPCMEEGHEECFFIYIHVPEHFTGIWVQGKPRQLGKSVITLELPIS